MLFEVLAIYRNGVRMTAEEIEASPRTLGNLQIRDWGDATNAFKRNIRFAEVISHKVGTGFPPHGLMGRLFDPVIVRMGDSQFLLEGIELAGEPEARVEYKQAWLARFST